MTYQLTNLKPDLPDPRDYVFTGTTTGLPPVVDLRKYAGNIENQQNTNSCTANAGVSACEIWAKRAGKELDFSRLFLYYNERAEYPNLHGQDGGAYMRDICRCLNKQGVCLESTWPFVTWAVNDKPPEQAYKEAEAWKVGRYERIENYNMIGVKTALALGCPVLVGMFLKAPFLDFPKTDNSDGEIYQWYIVNSYYTKPAIGSHAMLIVGYDDNKQCWIVENSWGTGWGNNGYAFIPYGFAQADIHDLWVFTQFAGMTMDPHEQMVIRLYKAALNRAPEPKGLEYWTGELKRGIPLQVLAKEFINSPEFISRFGSNVDDETYVKLLYNNVLKRDPEPAGALYWKLRLNPLPQITRVDALCEFSESEENRAS
jgi:hypothetical protein